MDEHRREAGEQPGVVAFTSAGTRALDEMAARLAERYDGTTTSLIDLLDQVTSAEIVELADQVATGDHSAAAAAVESADEAARRRMETPHDRNTGASPPRRLVPPDDTPTPLGRTGARPVRAGDEQLDVSTPKRQAAVQPTDRGASRHRPLRTNVGRQSRR